MTLRRRQTGPHLTALAAMLGLLLSGAPSGSPVLAQAGSVPTLARQTLTGPPTVLSGAAPVIPTLPSAISGDPHLRGGLDSPPAGPDADLAFGAFQRGYYATALSEAMKRLKNNPKDGPAMALIGEIYAQGMAVRRDPSEAVKWDRLASQQGNREAEFSYGLAMLKGEGVTKDRAAAADMFQKAAAQGHPGALYNLGVMAIEGDGKSHDFSLAAVYFQRAADAGDIDALDALAALYRGGRGVPQDVPKAATFLKEAADQKHAGAQVEYAIMLFNGDGIPKNETEAVHYFQLAAFQGNPVAENRLARLYAAGRGVERDPVEAARWHIMARAAGIPDAWLDSQLTQLSQADKARVEDVLRKQLGH